MMIRLSNFLALFALLQAANAWVINREVLKNAASVASVAAAISAAPLVVNAVNFSGSYADPKHPNCLRIIEVKGNNAALSGTDGNPACPVDGSGRKWNLEGKIKGNEIFVDFSPKGGPKDLIGKWESDSPAGIRFPDGNKWTKK